MIKKYTRLLHSAVSSIVVTVSVTAAIVVQPAHAVEDASEVSKTINKFIQQGQLPEAMHKADAFLTHHPKDAQIRFLKGLIFAEQNKTNDAITVFSKLTEDYPQLPEPHNNLAVLYATTNQYDKARAALESAIRTNPSYGTAHENLGDVYAKLASQSYDKALQLDSGNAAAKLKLTLIRNLFTNSNNAVAANSSITPVAQVAIANPVDTKNRTAPAPTSTTAATATTAAVTPPPATPPATPTVVAAPAKTVAAKTEVAKVENTAKVDTATKSTKVAAIKPDVKETKESKSTENTANTGEHDDVLKVVDAWAAAWSNRNTNAYLAFYGKDFDLPKGATRKSWADSRRVRIEGKGHISVKVSSPKIAVSGNTATVKFRQIYNSDQLKADSRKILVLTKQSGKWQITQERSGG